MHFANVLSAGYSAESVAILPRQQTPICWLGHDGIGQFSVPL